MDQAIFLSKALCSFPAAPSCASQTRAQSPKLSLGYPSPFAKQLSSPTCFFPDRWHRPSLVAPMAIMAARISDLEATLTVDAPKNPWISWNISFTGIMCRYWP
ncbi:uncharacterized protein BDV17DRAFT_257083 [Aspergillus undulatus]|uniref:uncharacterized protein n=1 Tax=Aspergillus undulatus TaxID=1810928 RepID=UPI003CCD0AE0